VTEITVPLVSRRREWVQLFQKFQHALPAPVLIGDGLHRFTERAAPWSVGLGVAEVGAGAVVTIALLRALRGQWKGAARAHHAHRMDWIDMFLGVMVLVEALVHYQETGRLQRPTILLGVSLIGLGLVHGWLIQRASRRRTLRVTDEGISVSERFSRRFSVRWPEVAEIQVSSTRAYVIAHDGREHRFDLEDLTAAADVRQALLAAQARWQPALPPSTV
jgi:hypothetical protein